MEKAQQLVSNPASSDRQKQSAPNRVAIGKTLAILFCKAPNGKTFGVTIDREDLPRVQAAGKWNIANFDSCNGRINLYCYAKKGQRTLYLHRFITNAPKDPSVEVDHIHHRNFDNRKAELRLATKSENQRNKRPPDKRECMRIATSGLRFGENPNAAQR